MNPTHKIKHWKPSVYQVRNETELDVIIVTGRDRWALEQLITSGVKGLTPIDNPAPRWSGYVHNLRGMGVEIETIHERHEGPFAGTHARYVLHSEVTQMNQSVIFLLIESIVGGVRSCSGNRQIGAAA